MAMVYSGEKIFPKASNPESGAPTLQATDDRQTDRRICDSKDPNVT